MFNDNKELGKFDLVGLPPAPRGVPQIEVTFDIDSNGIVAVSAKDLGTGKEQSIKITASTNLSDEEIEKMKKDAEAHAEEDKKLKEKVEIINQAESLVFQSEKLFKDFEGKVDKKEVEDVKADIEEIKKLLEPEEKDVDTIKKKMESINEKIQKLSTELYKNASAEQQKAGAANPGEQASGEKKAEDENVVDAEFEEVKDEVEENK